MPIASYFCVPGYMKQPDQYKLQQTTMKGHTPLVDCDSDHEKLQSSCNIAVNITVFEVKHNTEMMQRCCSVTPTLFGCL